MLHSFKWTGNETQNVLVKMKIGNDKIEHIDMNKSIKTLGVHFNPLLN